MIQELDNIFGNPTKLSTAKNFSESAQSEPDFWRKLTNFMNEVY
jgi:hypothetical protein